MENSTIDQTGENKSVSLFRNALNYGLYTSIGFIIVSLLFYALDVDRTGWVNYLTFIVLIVGIYFGIKTFRDKHSGGYLSYGSCLGTGVIISVVVGVVMAVYTYLFFQYFDPSELTKILEMTSQKLADKGLTDEQIDQAMAISSKFMTPAMMAISSIFGMALWGTIFSLLISIFLKKNDDSFTGTHI
jgi:ABC-type transport system involved in cytochrome c biogenesis permease subunit